VSAAPGGVVLPLCSREGARTWQLPQGSKQKIVSGNVLLVAVNTSNRRSFSASALMSARFELCRIAACQNRHAGTWNPSTKIRSCPNLLC